MLDIHEFNLDGKCRKEIRVIVTWIFFVQNVNIDNALRLRGKLWQDMEDFQADIYFGYLHGFCLGKNGGMES